MRTREEANLQKEGCCFKEKVSRDFEPLLFSSGRPPYKSHWIVPLDNEIFKFKDDTPFFDKHAMWKIITYGDTRIQWGKLFRTVIQGYNEENYSVLWYKDTMRKNFPYCDTRIQCWKLFRIVIRRYNVENYSALCIMDIQYGKLFHIVIQGYNAEGILK